MTVRNTVPMLEIHQEFLTIPSELTDALRAMIVGPHYYLCRYTDATEKASGALGDYDYTIDTEYNWPGRPAGGIVDCDYTRLFIDDALHLYFHEPAYGASLIAPLVQPVTGFANQIHSDTIVWRTANGFARSAGFYDRDVTIGDVIVVAGQLADLSVITHTTEVAGFDYEEIAATIAAAGTDDVNNAPATAAASSTAAVNMHADVTVNVDETLFNALPSGEVAETYVMTCTQAMIGVDITTARFRLTSASGKDDVNDFQFAAWATLTTIGNFGGRVSFTDAGAAEIAVGDNVTLNFAGVEGANFVEAACTTGGVFTGASDLTYIIESIGVSADGLSTVLQITTTTGADSSGPHTVLTATAQAIGNYGVTVNFDEIPCPGDRWYVACTAVADGACQTIILRRSMPAALATAEVAGEPVDLEVWLYIEKDIEVIAADFDCTQDDINVHGAITGTDSTWTDGGVEMEMPVLAGSLFVHYRALRQEYTIGRSVLYDAEDVIAELGPISADNPLALGVYLALLNSQGVEVGFIAVPTNDLAGYTSALQKIQDDERAYSIVPLSQLATIQSLVEAHVLAQSAADRRRFRICWLNSAGPADIAISTETTGEEIIKATISDAAPLDSEDEYLLVTAVNAQFVTDGVRAGDKIRINYDADGNYDEYTIDEVLAEDMLLLLTGPAGPIAIALRAEIWRTQTATEQATLYAAKSAAFGHRRIRHIWPDTIELDDGTSVAGYYGCCGEAGKKSAAAPHQPLSRTVLNGFGSANRSLVDMREEHLDIMARTGTWIITQDQVSGEVYTRLSVTTDDSDANHWQDARTTNVDSISFGFNNRFKSIVGTANITERLLSFIANEIKAAVEFFKSESNTPTLGSQLIEGMIVRGPIQSETLRDQVEVDIALEIPYAMDNLTITLIVE